jgi:hypothetical protein
VKCLFTVLSARAPIDAVVPSNPLDINSQYAALPVSLADTSCLGGYDSSVRE